VHVCHTSKDTFVPHLQHFKRELCNAFVISEVKETGHGHSQVVKLGILLEMQKYQAFGSFVKHFTALKAFIVI
jgi:hypothetical protein